MRSDTLLQDIDEGQNGKRNSLSQDTLSFSGKEDENLGRNDQSRSTDADDSMARPAKKAKRAKYISRACTSCQVRKIKCDGGDPCAPCAAKHRTCTSTSRVRRQQRQDDEIRVAGNSPRPIHSVTINDQVLSRLATVEHELRKIRQSNNCARNQLLTFPRRPSAEDPAKAKADVDMQRALEPVSQTFAGEISVSPIFEDADGDGDPSDTRGPASGNVSAESSILISMPESAEMVAPWLQKLLEDHDIIADRQEWQDGLQTYLEEVHPIYPCMHTPSLRDTLNELWKYPCQWPLLSKAEREHKRMSVALFFLCLSLGRCCKSSRMTDPTGLNSSGWSLYSVGMDLLRDVMETSHPFTRSLQMLQVLICRVQYLFRLDANQQAARVMAILVSTAHSMGLHRQEKLDNMPAFQHQLHCRVWWVIYALDRRIAVESGHPFLIQDGNVDTALPLDLGNEWMSRYSARSETIAELYQDIAEETARGSPSEIPYLVAIVRYSRAAGKAWDILYGIKPCNMSSHTMVEYVDMTLCKMLDTAPAYLTYDPKVAYEAQFSTKPRWLVKQTFTLLTCCTYLRVLIRKPFTRHPGTSHGEDEEFESATSCASIAAEILARQEKIDDDMIKYSFAMIHYVASCTMVMIGLVSREPRFKSRYGDLLESSLRCLNAYCHKIWTSGKMARLVSRLDRLVQRILDRDSMYQPQQRPAQESTRSQSYSVAQQQLTPRSDKPEASKVQQDFGQPMLDLSATNTLPTEYGGAYKEQRTTDVYYPDRAMLTGARDDVAPTAWMAEPPPPLDDRMNCLMSDFDFEIMVNDGERLVSSENGRSPRHLGGNDAVTDRDFDTFKMGALGLTGLMDLDTGLDSSVLYKPSILDIDLPGN